jgi:hypothetical protein
VPASDLRRPGDNLFSYLVSQHRHPRAPPQRRSDVPPNGR